MPKKRLTQQDIGFTRGVAYCVAALTRYNMDAKELLRQSGIPTNDFRKYCDEDIDDIEGMLQELEKQGYLLSK